ncbi:MAG: DUF3109 family protein [Chlorobi bacterium]|nr:DUF3109 family protein [Chlorobiota bacterium]
MLEIGRTIISLDVIEEQFLCDLIKCKGACCVEGDSGAPLSKEEAVILEENYPEVAPLLPEANKKAIEEWGASYVDKDGDTVTTLVNNRECAFAYRDKKGILKCSIEKAFLDGKINFRKPLSCHLFPIRITEYKRFDAVNYEQLEICSHGRACGSSNKLPLFKFLKEPLICKYGEKWYEELEIAASFLNKK